MRLDRDSVRAVVLGAIGVLAFPSSAMAQTAKVGIVAALQGTASVSRASVPDPAPLKFKDDVFVKDTITTAQSSIARILFGGAAVVTIREYSALTIHDRDQISTLDLRTGRLALSVVKGRLKPGQSLYIKTPHAMAAVRGTVVLADVTPNRTTFTLLKGLVEVTRLDPATRQPIGAPVTLTRARSLTVSGAPGAEAPRRISAAEAAALASDFEPARPISAAGASTALGKTHMEQAKAELEAVIDDLPGVRHAASTTGLSSITTQLSGPIATSTGSVSSLSSGSLLGPVTTTLSPLTGAVKPLVNGLGGL